MCKMAKLIGALLSRGWTVARDTGVRGSCPRYCNFCIVIFPSLKSALCAMFLKILPHGNVLF